MIAMAQTPLGHGSQNWSWLVIEFQKPFCKLILALWWTGTIRWDVLTYSRHEILVPASNENDSPVADPHPAGTSAKDFLKTTSPVISVHILCIGVYEQGYVES